MTGDHSDIRAYLIAFTLVACAWCARALADDVSHASSKKAPAELAKQVMEVTDAVLDHHIDPPSRQQMILDGVKALYRKVGAPCPDGLSRRVSELTSAEQIAAFLSALYPKPAAGTSTAVLDESFLDGLLARVPGQARMVSAKERKVEEQFAGNRYVGLHIALAMNEQEKRPTMADIFEGGPADRAGVKKGDVLEQIDGVDTKGMPLREAVDRLRGAEGTYVTIKVRQPKAKEPREYKIVRGQLPHATVRGFRKRSSGGWDVRLDGPDPIGYLQITEVMASTPHELRKLASQLESDDARALVLDLRGLSTDNLHSAVVIADSFLDHGCIGRVKTSHGETKYEAEPDALFPDWPMVVLIDQSTWGTAEWLAAALQDNHRAIVVGMPSASSTGKPGAGVKSTFPLGDGSYSITLITGQLERGDGRSLALSPVGSPEFNGARSVTPADEDKATDLHKQRLAALATTSNGSTLDPDTLAANQAHVREAKSKYGVKPDHTAGSNRPARPGSRRQDTTQPRSPESDETLKKAVEVLRKALKNH
jgi:carboxyl-terminal processing protease